MTPTQENRAFSLSYPIPDSKLGDAGLRGERDERVHLCSMGEGAATPDDSTSLSSSSMKSTEFRPGSPYVPVGKQTSYTHC